MGLLDAVADRVMHLPPPLSRDIETAQVRVPLADGVTLLATRYWQAGRSGDPVILMRSPYGRGSFLQLLGRAYAARGAQALVVSCRGTFGSGGDWMPMRDEASDGLATFRWLEQQPWFGGSAVLAGPSYLGYTQWATAVQIPGSIAAIIPHVTSSRLTLPFIRPDALDWDLLVRWNFLLENQEKPRAFLRSALRLDEKRLQTAMMTLPRESVDLQLAGHRWQFFQDCLRHDSNDPHWATTDHSGDVAALSTPASYVGGWYDIFLSDQLRDYAATVKSGAPQRLTIGPWVHGSPAGIGAAACEALYFGLPHSRGGTPGTRAPVRLYVMGTSRKGSAAPGIAGRAARPWRDFESWPPPGYPGTRLHLTPGAGLSTATPPVAAQAGPSAPSRFRYDPADPTPSAGGPFLSNGAGPKDNRKLESRSDVLTFTTTPLAGDVEVIGEVAAEIWFASNRKSADLFVRLCDVDRRGRSTNICDGIVGVDADSDGTNAGPVTVAMWPTAYLFRKGHRIRVQVSSGSHPRYARNPGTGEPRATATELLVAEQSVWHDADRPSAVVLPVLAGHRMRLD
jgi:putative CocE/NonD family hydrolase